MDMFQMAGCLCMLLWLVSLTVLTITAELLAINPFQRPN